MAVHKILKMGDPRLLDVSEAVRDVSGQDIQDLIRDMKETMEANDGAGLAAPQVGIPKRVVIFGVAHNPRYPEVEPIDMTVLINPEIEILDNSLEGGWEGCLSIPGMRGLVPRYRKIRYQGVNEFGEPISRVVSDFHARVVQHEVDHLDGILYPMRMPNLSNFGYEDSLFSGI